MRRLSSSTLFPYTTLFRSFSSIRCVSSSWSSEPQLAPMRTGLLCLIAISTMVENCLSFLSLKPTLPGLMRYLSSASAQPGRSEEHTSELQSRENLVCRLLLDAASLELYTLSLHDALPIFLVHQVRQQFLDE